MPSTTRRQVLRGLPALLLAAGLPGCGGGLYLEIGDDDWVNDDPPQVSLVASAATASAGATVRLAAAATDDIAVDRVQFYRVERDGASTLLATDRSAPYEIDTVLPAGTGGQWRFFARATDGRGQSTDSAEITIIARL